MNDRPEPAPEGQFSEPPPQGLATLRAEVRAGLEALRREMQASLDEQERRLFEKFSTLFNSTRAPVGISEDGAAAEVAEDEDAENPAADLPAPESPAEEPQQEFIAYCDLPSADGAVVVGETIRVEGWALSPAGIREVETAVDGQVRGRIPFGRLRPDLAEEHPEYPDAEWGGFAGSLTLGKLTAGEHTLTIRITAQDGQQCELRRVLYVK